MQITVIGTGYVGLVTGVCLSEVGHNVTCVDVDATKIDCLNAGQSPIYEPGLAPMIQENSRRGRLSFTTDLKAAMDQTEVAFICVGTPEGEDGSADLKYVEAAAKDIAGAMTGPVMVVVKSTVPVGTGDRVEELIAKHRAVKADFQVVSNPEFLKEGDAIQDCMRPDRVVVGVTDPVHAEVLRSMYHPFIMDDPRKLLVMDRRSSELTKYGANSMLAARVSFMNELSQLCEKLGADIESIRRGMGTDDRIGKKFLYAGPGYGGSCFPKDVEALLKIGAENGIAFNVLKAVSHANKAQKDHVAQKIKDHFQDLSGLKIGVWGLAFKPGTDDVREAPSKTIISHLLSWGASVYAHDPKASEAFQREFPSSAQLLYTQDAYEVLEGADALVLLTEWSQYRRPDWQKIDKMMRQKVVFDLRNQYEGQELIPKGFHYQCVGRPDSKTLT